MGGLFLWGLWISRRRQPKRLEKLPDYEGPYKQRLRWQLVSYEYGVTGRPDFILADGESPVPVMVKKGKAPGDYPHDSHVAQILVYCLLIHQAVDHAPRYGVIRYDDRTFEVDYNEPVVLDLLELIDEIRAQHNSLPDRSHADERRCVACSHRRICDESLT